MNWRLPAPAGSSMTLELSSASLCLRASRSATQFRVEGGGGLVEDGRSARGDEQPAVADELFGGGDGAGRHYVEAVAVPLVVTEFAAAAGDDLEAAGESQLRGCVGDESRLLLSRFDRGYAELRQGHSQDDPGQARSRSHVRQPSRSPQQVRICQQRREAVGHVLEMEIRLRDFPHQSRRGAAALDELPVLPVRAQRLRPALCGQPAAHPESPEVVFRSDRRGM